MSRLSPTAHATPHATPILPLVRRLCWFLSHKASRRVADMAGAMREAALNDEACQAWHLRAAGFSTAEIGLAWPLACAALHVLDGRDEHDTPDFTPEDVHALRRFNRLHPDATLALAA